MPNNHIDVKPIISPYKKTYRLIINKGTLGNSPQPRYDKLGKVKLIVIT